MRAAPRLGGGDEGSTDAPAMLVAPDAHHVELGRLPRVLLEAEEAGVLDGKGGQRGGSLDVSGGRLLEPEPLWQVAENDLMQSYAMQFQDARERDHGAGNENAVTSFRRANDEWRQYRDAECARRRDHAPKGVAAEDFHMACMVELTRRRALDMR